MLSVFLWFKISSSLFWKNILITLQKHQDKKIFYQDKLVKLSRQNFILS